MSVSTPAAAKPESPLANKKVVVVGASSGMGLATARSAAAAGADVVVVSSSSENLQSAVQAMPSTTAAHVVSVLDRKGLDALFAEVGRFDHLVYTAGDRLLVGPISQLATSDVQAAFDVRYFGALRTISAATPHISDTGSITLTSGVASVRPHGTSGVAASICGAMEALTRALAVELSPLRVNLIRPGLTRTGLWSGLDERVREEMYEKVGQSNLVGHVAEPAELANAFIYCMSQTYATGSILHVDGGAALV